MPNTRRWKAVELAIAHIFNSSRTGPLGREEPDVITDKLCIEVKSRLKEPGWIRDAMNQVLGRTPEEKLGIVILHAKGIRHEDDMVILRLADFMRWFPQGEKSA